jgi:hypothetical protein
MRMTEADWARLASILEGQLNQLEARILAAVKEGVVCTSESEPSS